MEEWLRAFDAVCRKLNLKEFPAPPIFNRTFKRIRGKLLEQIHRTLLDDLQLRELGIFFDMTGYSLTQASVHHLARRGRKYLHS